MNTIDFSVPITAFIIAAVLSGCAGASSAREMSAIGAKFTNDYKTGAQEFFQAQDAMNQGVLQSIASRKQLAAQLDNQTRVQRASWQAANNTAAIRMYDALFAQSQSAILASNIDLQSLHTIELPSPTTIDPKQFDAVTKTLNQMAQPLSLQDQISFLVKYGQDVASQYKQSLADGAKCANKAAATTKQPAPSDKPPASAPTPAPSNCN